MVRGGSRTYAALSRVTFVGEERFQLVFDDAHANGVSAVDDEDDGLGVLVVMFPQVPVASLARHVEHGELGLPMPEVLDLEPNCGLRLGHLRYPLVGYATRRHERRTPDLVLGGLQEIDHARLAAVV